jgi:hypothetical protein
MPEINDRSLCVAIRLVAAEIRTLRAAFADGGANDDESQMLESLELVAEDLERAYDKAAGSVLNLPPYDELVGER